MERTVEQVRAAVARHCSAPGDSRALRAQVLTDLRRVLPFDWYVWVVTDPHSAVGVDPLAEVPDLRLLPTVIRLKYATSLNRWTELTSAARLGSHAVDSPLWRQIQSPAGIVDVASVVFRDRHGCWGFLDLWSRIPFTAEHLRLLDDLSAALARALRERQAAMLRLSTGAPTSIASAPAAGASVAPARMAGASIAGPAVVLLDDDLALQGMTPAASSLLSQLLPRPDGEPSVPAAAYNVAAQLLAGEDGVAGGPPEGRVHLSGGHWITVRASRLDPGARIAVSLEAITPAARLDLCVRAFALSARETEIVRSVTAGESSAQISRGHYLSAYTVQDHLKSIFIKTGVTSRRELVPLMLGTGGDQGTEGP